MSSEHMLGRSSRPGGSGGIAVGNTNGVADLVLCFETLSFTRERFRFAVDSLCWKRSPWHNFTRILSTMQRGHE